MGKEYFSTSSDSNKELNSEALNKVKNIKFKTSSDCDQKLPEKTPADNMIGYRVKASDNNGGVEILGKRSSQEDRMIIAEELPGFDQLSDYEPPNAEPAQESARKQVIRKTFEKAQASLQNIKKGGSTAIVSITQGNDIYTAGLGDSVTYKVVRRKSTGEVISCQRLNQVIHKPSRDEEKRVKSKGGTVENGYLVSKNGVHQLGMTRAFGDKGFEEVGLSHDPGIIYCDKIADDPQSLDPDLEIFQITSCDGLTEPVERIDVPRFAETPLVANLKEKLEQEQYKKFEHKDEKYIAKLVADNKELRETNPDFSIVATELAKQAMADGSTDNISINIRRLDPGKKVAELAAIFDGHGNALVSEALANEKKGFVAILKNNIKKILDKKKEYIQKLNQSLINHKKDFEVLSDDKGQFTTPTRIQVLLRQKDNPKFVAVMAGNKLGQQEVYDDAKADPEAAKQIFLAKNYIEFAGGFKKTMKVLSAKQVVELLKLHVKVAGFVEAVCNPINTNINLVRLAKTDVANFGIIVNTPELFAKLDDKQRNEIVQFYLAHPQEEALSIMVNKPELYVIAGRKNLLKMATPYTQKDDNPKFLCLRAQIKLAAFNKNADLNLKLAQLYADAGSPRAQYYLSVLCEALASNKTYKQVHSQQYLEETKKISFQWLEKAANNKKGPIQAKCELAKHYLERIDFLKLTLNENEDLIQKAKELTSNARKALGPDEQYYKFLNKKIEEISADVSKKETEIEAKKPKDGELTTKRKLLFTHHR